MNLTLTSVVKYIVSRSDLKYTMLSSDLKGELYHDDYHIWNGLSIVSFLIILIVQYPKRIQNTKKIMNKIIPLNNSIILYFLFLFYFFPFQIFHFKFFISKFSKLKKFFQKIFHILWVIFVPRFLIHALYPPLWCVYFHTLKRCHVTTLSLYYFSRLKCIIIHWNA